VATGTIGPDHARGIGMRIAIVGGGIVGLSAALELSRAGHRVELLEQGPIPNPLAASHDRHRLIRLAHSPEDGRGRIIGAAFAAWDALWAELGQRHYRPTGMLMTARAPGDWAHACRAAFERDGVPFELWDRAMLARRCPFLALGPDDWGLFTAAGGALLADRIVEDLAALLAVRGVVLRPHTAVAAIAAEGPTLTLADGGRLDADALILAAGAWTGRLLPELAARSTPKRNTVLYLEPPPDLAAGWSGSPCFLDFGGTDDLYLIPPTDGIAMKFGAGANRADGDPSAPRALGAGEIDRLLAMLRPFIRDLDRYRLVDHRVCFYSWSADERFVAGRLAAGPVVYATGCTGQMFKFGPLVGRWLAEAALGRLESGALAARVRGEPDQAAAA
jgi:sarcosine oxidase